LLIFHPFTLLRSRVTRRDISVHCTFQACGQHILCVRQLVSLFPFTHRIKFQTIPMQLVQSKHCALDADPSLAQNSILHRRVFYVPSVPSFFVFTTHHAVQQVKTQSFDNTCLGYHRQQLVAAWYDCNSRFTAPRV